MARTNETSFDDAQAWCDLAEAVDLGRIASANRIAGEHRLAIDRLWAPEDDGLQQAAGGYAVDGAALDLQQRRGDLMVHGGV